MSTGIAIKRVYDAPEKSDGFRVLVDRVWPRGVSKEKVAVDLWTASGSGFQSLFPSGTSRG